MSPQVTIERKAVQNGIAHWVTVGVAANEDKALAWLVTRIGQGGRGIVGAYRVVSIGHMAGGYNER